jgi:outer membrane lipoprotein LolB
MRRSALPPVAAVLAVLLASCRTVAPPVTQVNSWQLRRTELQALSHFELKGRVAVAARADGFNANLRWVQEGTRAQLSLEGPLGVGGAQVSAAGDDLTVQTSRGEHFDSAAAHEALVARLGFDPPLSSMRYWVLGVPDPAQPSTEELDSAQQQLTALTQGGWHIDYGSYMQSGARSLPARLTLQREGVRVRLLVDDWHL